MTPRASGRGALVVGSRRSPTHKREAGQEIDQPKEQVLCSERTATELTTAVHASSMPAATAVETRKEDTGATRAV